MKNISKKVRRPKMKMKIEKYLENKKLFDSTEYSFLSTEDKQTIEDFISISFEGLYIAGNYTEETVESYVQKKVRTLLKANYTSYTRLFDALNLKYDLLDEINLVTKYTGTQDNNKGIDTTGDVVNSQKVLPYDSENLVEVSENKTSYNSHHVQDNTKRTDNLQTVQTGTNGNIADKVMKEIEIAKTDLLEKITYDIVNKTLICVWGLNYEEESY